MKIELEVERDTPLSIADALIAREFGYTTRAVMEITEAERLRQIGQALINFVESNERATVAINIMHQ